MLWLTGPHLNWVVLVSFTPFLYSGFYSLFCFGLKILLTLTLGSRKHFLPKSLVFQTMAWSVRRLRRYSLMFLSRTCAHRSCDYPSFVNHYGWLPANVVHTFFSNCSCFTRCNELSYRRFVRHQLSWVSKVLRLTIRSSEILRSLMFMTFLTCLHYG